jgi:hypothetical protein
MPLLIPLWIIAIVCILAVAERIYWYARIADAEQKIENLRTGPMPYRP